jgi:hypothetical protein
MWFGIQKTYEIQETAKAKVIEFYVPKNFRDPRKPAAEMQFGKVIEFCSPARKSA